MLFSHVSEPPPEYTPEPPTTSPQANVKAAKSLYPLPRAPGLLLRKKLTALVIPLVLAGLQGASPLTAAEVHAGNNAPHTSGLSGEYTLTAQDLRTRKIRVQFPKLKVISHSLEENPRREWESTFTPCWKERNLYRLHLRSQTATLRRDIEYLIRKNSPQNAATLRPVLATETVTAADRGFRLSRQQTLDFQIKGTNGGKNQETDMKTATLWAVKNPESVYEQNVLIRCSNYMWHHQALDDPPGSFNGIIELTFRRVELQPKMVDPYSTIAWLLWSKWVTWKKSPEDMPDGKGGIKKAIRVLRQGKVPNSKNPEYYFEAATTMMPVAQNHRPEIYRFVTDYLKQANKLAQDDGMHAETRKVLGHCYRHMEKPEKAIAWYRKVLDVESDHKIAKKYIRKLRQADKSNDDSGNEQN